MFWNTLVGSIVFLKRSIFFPNKGIFPKKIRFNAPGEPIDFAWGKYISTLLSGRHKSCKECILALSTVEDHHGERIPSVFSPDLGKKPLSVSRGENKSGRWSNRASTTLPTGYFPAPEIRRTVPTMDTRRFELPIAVAIIPWSVINRRSCIQLVKLGIHGTRYRKDALRDSFLFRGNVYSGGQNFVTS